MRVLGLRRRGVPVLAALLVSATIAGCQTDVDPTAPATESAVPADLLLAPADLPPGFDPAQLSVSELVEGNGARIESAADAEVQPPFCRPTADADLNPRLDDVNSAILAARAASASLVELVTTAPRDIAADIGASTGRCAVTTTIIRAGTLQGARIVTRHTRLPIPPGAQQLSALRQSVLLRSDVTTTLPDGSATNQVGFAGYADLGRESGAVTVQLTVSGDAPPVAEPPPAPEPPMSDAAFGALFDEAVAAAAR
ncbi:hypothetical protein VZC37_05760 [Gordonia sp. LSe1-13]|uniref:DUF5642 domain-containing protein n=1 Tax=Gordonia sesuvii TaxID=3116777 RepID=A0ABU7M9N5_9ACTN|nr:hypothetical protein [Gordonia sp. LSe1-13]